MKFRHEIDRRSPGMKRIIYGIKKDGYYYFDGQRRKPTNVRKDGAKLIIEGDVINVI